MARAGEACCEVSSGTLQVNRFATVVNSRRADIRRNVRNVRNRPVRDVGSSDNGFSLLVLSQSREAVLVVLPATS